MKTWNQRIALIGLILFEGTAVSGADAVSSNRPALLSLEVSARDNNGRDLKAVGTGFLIHPGGYGLTSSHLFDNLVTSGAIESTIKVTAHVADFSSPAVDATYQKGAHDIAFVKLSYRVNGYSYSQLVCNSGFDISNLQMRSAGFPFICSTYDSQAKTCLSGSPHFVPTEGRASQAGDGMLPDTMNIAMRFDYGASGSPIYLESGLVAGVAKGNVISSESLGEFVPVSWADSLIRGIPGLPTCVDVSACVNSTTVTEATTPFTISGGARAPGTGFNTTSQYNYVDVCFNAPPGSEIVGSVSVVNNGSNGGRGSLGALRYISDAAGITTGVCIKATAWSDSNPFGAGGWQNVTLSGATRKRSSSVATAEDARRRCASADRP